MSKQLEEIFNECVERLQRGDSIENCLLSYPEFASELEILLRTTLNVNWRGSMVQPRPQFKARARFQFINAQYATVQAKQAKPTFFSLQRAWAPALAMVLLLIFSSVGTAAAASNAMPDQPLYPVKLATEQVRLTLAFSDKAKAEINVHLVDVRSQEIATMAAQGKPEQVIIATEKLEQHLEAAELAITKVDETKPKQAQSAPAKLAPPASMPLPVPSTVLPSEKAKEGTGQPGGKLETAASIEAEKLRQSLKTSISKNVTVMEDARGKAPDKSKEVLQRAIDMAKTKQNQIQHPGTGTQNKPGATSPTTPTIHLDPMPPQYPKNPPNLPVFPNPKLGPEQTPQSLPGSKSTQPTPVTPLPPVTPTNPK